MTSGPHRREASDIVEWLRTSGASFEMAVAQTLMRKPLRVRQGHAYTDPVTGKPREMDVLVSRGIAIDQAVLEVFAVIECKYAFNPWVLFRQSPYNTHAAPDFDARIASPLGAKWLSKARVNDQLRKANMFEREPRPGYALATTQFDDPPAQQAGNQQRGSPRQRRAGAGEPEQDMAYKAMVGVVHASLDLRNELGAADFPNPRRIATIFPVIALRGQLFEAWLEDDGNFFVRDIARGQVLWSNPASPNRQVLIDVMVESEVAAFGEDLVSVAESIGRFGVEDGRAVVLENPTGSPPFTIY